jgi:hypothetical protein
MTCKKSGQEGSQKAGEIHAGEGRTDCYAYKADPGRCIVGNGMYTWRNNVRRKTSMYYNKYRSKC